MNGFGDLGAPAAHEQVRTAIYTLDLAETAEGDWILIEINDAQMAVPSEHDLDALYGKLKETLADR